MIFQTINTEGYDTERKKTHVIQVSKFCQIIIQQEYPMSACTDYVLKRPFHVYLSRAALKLFRLEEFITFESRMFQLLSLRLVRPSTVSL